MKWKKSLGMRKNNNNNKIQQQNKTKNQRPNQLCVSFFAKKMLRILIPKFQLEAERSEVLEQIVTKAQYVLNLMTK